VLDILRDFLGRIYEVRGLLTWGGYPVLMAIIFAETGLLVGFFLPGDSLLVTAGVVAYLVDWPIHILIPTLCLAAILGDAGRGPQRAS